MATALILVCACSEDKKQDKKVEDVKNAFVLEKQQVGKTINRPAELLPYDRAEIYAKVEGFVKRVSVDIGDRVKAGRTLAVLDAPEVAAESSRASADYQKANAQYMASLDRYERLEKASREEGVIAQGELTNARNRMMADSAAIASARSSARAFGQMQGYLTLRAPFDGIVTKRAIDPGDFVGDRKGGSLFTLVNADKLRIRVHIPETYVNSIPAAGGLTFSTSSARDTTFTAELSRRSGSIDPGTRTELWEYEFDNTGTLLKPGMYATAELNLNRDGNSFVVPFTAVVTSMEKKFVVKVVDGKVSWVDVTEGISLKDGIEVFGKLKEGDTLLVRGSEEIRPDTPIKVKITEKQMVDQAQLP